MAFLRLNFCEHNHTLSHNITAKNDTGSPEKSEHTQLTLSMSRENKEKLQRIVKRKGMTTAGVLASWMVDYEEKDSR